MATRVGKSFLNFLKCFLFVFQVKDILQHYPDLVNGFNDFLGHCENIGGSFVLNATLLDAPP
jgi:histone deacetylase complex regulatory component SIN3